VSVRNVLYALVLVAGLWQGHEQWLLRPVHPPDGAIAPLDPLQTDIAGGEAAPHGRWQLTPRAHYDITARILSREDYHFDALSDLIPEDLALGWGPMSDNQMLKLFDVSQGARFYSWQSRGPLPMPRRQIVEHSANTHVIPVDGHVRRELARLRVGQVVHLSGLLVDGKRDDGASIRTSLTRSDEGAGACEILLVDTVEVLPPSEP
jgi:hypothetical protein